MSTLETALGALLHDVGKFSQRAFREREGLSPQSLGMMPFLCPTGQHGQSTHLHVLYTNEFVEHLPFLPAGLDRSRVANLAAYHHRPDTAEQRVITRADCLSSGMERQASEELMSGGATRFRRVRLHSTTSTVSLPDVAATQPVPLGLAELTPEEAFPLRQGSERDLTSEYQVLWQRFVAAWQSNRCPEPLGFVNRAMSILERFTWCIPSATNAVPDISLFDHLKTTAAIAACVEKAGDAAAEPFLLVAADLTGIQRYIFDIRPGRGGLARRLRARSLQVATYLESVSLSLLERIGLPLCQRILFAGGKFHLLLPNVAETHEVLQSAKSEVSRWLFDVSAGEVGLAMAAVPLNDDGLKDFPDSLALLNAQLREARDRAGEAVLIAGGPWREDSFLLPPLTFGDGESLCRCCEKRAGRMEESSAPETAVCPKCEGEEQLGRLLPRSRYIDFFGGQDGGNAAPLGSFQLRAADDHLAPRAQVVVDLDGLGDGPKELPLVGGFRSRFVPHDAQSGAVVMFDELAGRSLGRKALGFLKMDVDNLGHLFCTGFRGGTSGLGDANQGTDEARDLTSISRVAALSRTLETFFSGYLERLLRSEFRNVYLIYSGGDDVAAVGPWNQMFDLALRLREQFRGFTGGNPCWTLSAGLTVVHWHVPVLAAVEQADQLLDASKTIVGDGAFPWPLPEARSGNVHKDRLTAFGTSIPWSEFAGTLGRARQLHQWLSDGTLRTSQLRRLLGYAEMACRFQRSGDTRCLQYVPYLVRELRRNWKEDTPAQREAREWAAQLTLPDAAEMKRLRFLCHYALYAHRTPEKEERP